MDSVVRTNPSGRPTRIPFDPRAVHGSVFQALLDARSEFGGGTPILVDGDGRVLTYDEMVRASFAHAAHRSLNLRLRGDEPLTPESRSSRCRNCFSISLSIGRPL